MIKIYIKKENKDIKYIEISGHAKYEEYGKDIVCAGVSSITITTINAILSFNETIKVTDNNILSINVLQNDNITNTLLNNMIDLLSQIEKEYPKNISIRMEEK